MPERSGARWFWRALRSGLCGYVLVSLLAILAWWGTLVWGAEDHWLSAALQYVPYWAMLAPLVLGLVLSLALNWRWRALACLALAVAVGPVMGLVLAQGDSGTGRVRLMTYNIKAYLNLQRTGDISRVVWEVAQHDPDIVVMQDAGEARADQQPLPPLVQQMVGDRQLYAFGQYIVASRFPMRDCAKGFISYDNQPHTYVHCIVRAHGRDIDLYTAHFLSPRDGLNALRLQGWDGRGGWVRSYRARLTQSQTLAQVLSKRQRPAIVAGDLNAPERSVIVRNLLDVGLRDAFSAAGWGYGYTHGHSLRPGVSINRIDHILVSHDIGVAQCTVGGQDASDHRPVIADLWVHRDE